MVYFYGKVIFSGRYVDAQGTYRRKSMQNINKKSKKNFIDF